MITGIDRILGLGLGLAEEWQCFKTSASAKHLIPKLDSANLLSDSTGLGPKTAPRSITE